jgi:hypothetical protein
MKAKPFQRGIKMKRNRQAISTDQGWKTGGSLNPSVRVDKARVNYKGAFGKGKMRLVK